MNKFVYLLELSFGMLAFTSTAYASDAIGPGDSDSTWVVGASVLSANNIYAGEDSETFVLPRVSYKGESFFLKNGTLNYSIFQRNNFSGGLLAGVDGTFLQDSSEYRNNEELAGLNERENTLEGGFYLNHTTELGRLKFTLATDLGNEHDGESASLSYTFDLSAGNWSINPRVGVNWQSSDKVDYYFGVSAAEVNVYRTAYKADSAFNASAGIRARYDITEHWDVNLETGVSFLDSSIKNSTIVDDGNGYYAGVSINYNF